MIPIPRRFSIGLLSAAAAISFAAAPARAESIYIATVDQGSHDGTSAANAHGVAWFNTSANWSSPTKVAGDIGPGDTVHLTGTITNPLTVQNGGTAPNGAGTGPIVVLFDPGASMTSAAWVPQAIFIGGLNYITIDGGATGTIGGPGGDPSLVNGIIQNTANGTALAQQAASNGIWVQDSTHITVQNIAIDNIYVREAGTDVAAGGTGVNFKWNGGQSSTNLLVTNCIIHDVSSGIFFDYAPGASAFEVSFCTFYNDNWGGAAGDHGATSTLTGLLVHDNYFHDWTNWDSPSDTYHHNGFYGWAESGGSLRNFSFYDNFVGPNYSDSPGGTNNSTSGMFTSGDIGGTLVYNNVFIEAPASGDSPGDGLVFVWDYKGTATTTNRVYNNTFVGGGGGVAIDLYEGLGPSQTTYDVKNNVITGMGTAVSVNYDAQSTVLSDYNDFYAIPSATEFSPQSADSANFQTYAQWRALGYDAHSITGNPGLNGEDALQAGSPAIRAGINLYSYFTIDKAGAARPQSGVWDIGAYQYSAAAAGGPASGLINAYAYPNPSVQVDPTLRAVMGQVSSVDVTIFNAAGRVVHSGSLAGAPTGVLPSGEYYYDYTWTGRKASGVYFAVLHGQAADGSVVKARIKFAVVQ